MQILDTILHAIMYPFIFISIYFQVFMLLNFIGGREKMKKEEEEMDENFEPSVTFLVPCWNEEKTLGPTIDSILDLNYDKTKLQIIIIDDGSKDNTFKIASDYAAKNTNITAITKVNGGKHTALNDGLKMVMTELVACLDADSFLHPNAMIVAAQYFKDKNIKALASCMQIKLPVGSWVQRIQQIEYMISVFWRKSYSNIDAVQVMPGPFSVFRSSVFTELGDYKPAHNAEDFEMTLRLHYNGYKIANAHKAYVYTVGPDTVRGLVKQRIRWVRGFLENAWDYRDMFFNRKYGHFGIFTLPIGIVFVFYILIAIMYAVLSFIKVNYMRIYDYSLVGWHWPHLQFEPFYVNTDTFLFLSIFVFTLLGCVLYTARNITESRDEFAYNLALYIFIYPFIVPFFIFTAVFKFLTNAKNVWALQDNKIL